VLDATEHARTLRKHALYCCMLLCCCNAAHFDTMTSNALCMACQLLKGSESAQVGAAHGMLRCLRMLAYLYAKWYVLSMSICYDLAIMANLGS